MNWITDLEFLEKQNEEFLALVKGKKIYGYHTKHIDDSQIIDGFIDDSPVIKRIGTLSQDGKILVLHRGEILFFSQSFSPNHGVYQNTLNNRYNNRYVGILYKNKKFYMWNTKNSDNLFKTKPRRIFMNEGQLYLIP